MKAKYIFILATVLLFINSSGKAVDNPFSYDTSINDCDVIKYNGEYYITGNWLSGDMYQSRNLTEWGERMHIFSWDNTWYEQRYDDRDKDIHGTHIAYDNGVFHLYAHMDQKIVHAISDSVTGPYTEPVDAPFETSCIDVKTFKDLDGSLHYYSTRFGGVSNNHNDYRTMSDYYTLTSSPDVQIWPIYDWELVDEKINEGSFVFRYRDRYYMLYNGNHTRAAEYAIGCVEADSPNGFSNSGKYPDPVLTMKYYTHEGTEYRIKTIGQPWLIEGLNGFEKWIGYFAKEPRVTGNGRTQRIDRVHFFDTHLYVDGPTISLFPGYHPGPVEPQLRSLFYLPDGPLPESDWLELSPGLNEGNWQVEEYQAYQSSQECFSFNLANREPATNYLFEANMKFDQDRDVEDKAGVVAYYKDANNWMLIGMDRSSDNNLDNWYCRIKTDLTDQIVCAGSFDGDFDYSVYHKIRVEKNGNAFRVLIDDVLPPDFANIETDFAGDGIPGLYADHAAAYYDGVIYTIGWDEFDEGIRGWGDGLDISRQGLWAVGGDGLFTLSKYSRIFKGNLMHQYEFSTQVYTSWQEDGIAGIYAAVIDQDNYIKAGFDLAENQFVVSGMLNGQALASQFVPISSANSYNLRVVKLYDRFYFFIDGQEVMSYEIEFPESQIGLFTESVTARFDGIMCFQISNGELPRPWKSTDIGDVSFAGNARYNEGTFSINGSGSDVWDDEDSFHYVYRELYGDGQISARFVSNDYTSSDDKAAIMFRDGLTNDAAMVMLSYCGDGALQYVVRSGSGETAQSLSTIDTDTDNIWLKIRRLGNRFYCYFSYDGNTWILMGSSMPGISGDYLNVGLAVCSHSTVKINGAVFDNVSIIGCAPGEYMADLNMDCIVDLDDFSYLSEQWLEEAAFVPSADFDSDGIVDMLDLDIFAGDWLVDSNN